MPPSRKPSIPRRKKDTRIIHSTTTNLKLAKSSNWETVESRAPKWEPEVRQFLSIQGQCLRSLNPVLRRTASSVITISSSVLQFYTLDSESPIRKHAGTASSIVALSSTIRPFASSTSFPGLPEFRIENKA